MAETLHMYARKLQTNTSVVSVGLLLFVDEQRPRYVSEVKKKTTISSRYTGQIPH